MELNSTSTASEGFVSSQQRAPWYVCKIGSWWNSAWKTCMPYRSFKILVNVFVESYTLIPHDWIKIPHFRLDSVENILWYLYKQKYKILPWFQSKFLPEWLSGLGERVVTSWDKFSRSFQQRFLMIFWKWVDFKIIKFLLKSPTEF